MINYNPNDIYILHPDWKLRNDGKYVIAGYYGQGGLGSIKRFGPIEGFAVSLFDGVRTCEDIKKISTAFFDTDLKKQEDYAEELVKRLISLHGDPVRPGSDPLLTPFESLSVEEKGRIRKYQPEKYIVKPKDFKPEEFKLLVPASILFLITNKCETNCQYCYMPRSIPVNDLLPWERMKELVYEAHSLGVMIILLSGGDPLCYPYIFELLELLEELDFEPIELPTKTYVSQETAARLAKCRIVKAVQFSIDSTVPEIADYLVQRPGFCERTLESIRNAMKAGIKTIRTKSVITPYNLATIPKLYRDLRGMGVSPVVLATYCRSGYWHNDKLFNYTDDYMWLDKELEKLKTEFPEDEIFYQNGPPQIDQVADEDRKAVWERRNRCTAGRDCFAVCANGKVIGCEQVPEREEDYLGDLRVQSIEEVWNSQLFNEYMLNPPMERFVGM